MRRYSFRALLLLACLGWCCAVAAEPQSEAVTSLLQSRIEQLRTAGTLRVAGGEVAAVRLIPEFYQRREYRLAWTRSDLVISLLHLVEASAEEGLNPDDYHFTILKLKIDPTIRPRVPEQQKRVDLDILMTDALVRLGYHTYFGKVNPELLDRNWNFERHLRGEDPVELMEAALASASLEAFFRDRLRGQAFEYEALQGALARYRCIREHGGWPTVAQGPALKPDMLDPRVPSIRRRLSITGDLASGEVEDPLLYDEPLQEAVRDFQERHGLETDAVVGKRTLAAMNVPVQARIDQIRVNLERTRWISGDLGKDYVIVDIAGFKVHLVRNGRRVWSARAVVGRPYRKTPVFKARMTYLEINPTWTVPPTILAKDILPKAAEDPSYLEKKHIRVLSRDGGPVDPAGLDWASFKKTGFPYILRQDPGPNNALGRIKFMFPNKHLVYLHDTPAKDLFDRSSRAFSSGCIRVERPFELAELVLDDPEHWNRAAIDALVASARTRRVYLERPLDVLLLYWTVDVGNDGRVYFKPDIYRRDRRVLSALDGEFTFYPPEGLPDWLQSSEPQ